ncbi:MAG: diaminopimelate epimerase [Candidatus Eremiobacterota bacterium]
MNFVKMHGLGNDFIIMDGKNFSHNNSIFSIKACDRHRGIGADGVIFILPSETASLKMRLFNSDGSEGEMCGNGIRCLAKYAFESGMVKEKNFAIETGAGLIVTEIIEEKGTITEILVDMGEPSFREIFHVINVDEKIFNYTSVLTGVPHAVIFEIPEDWEEKGRKIEINPIFPEKTNVDFVHIINKHEASVKVWERGAGKTLACGTGACAVLAAGVKHNILDRKAKINLPGGSLFIEWAEKDNHIYMTGPAEEIFRGTCTEKILGECLIKKK